ncbi:MAG TPA: DUF4037 domain-containing protein [Bacillota bacterium]|nr:DUF4037 domain-containing protein [Bacillota bacterium]
MKGLELSRRYYEEFGVPMLEGEFPELKALLACGLVGSGSECFGFDDELSKDHDFEPSFCIFLPGEDLVDRKTEFRLERAYAKLPSEFCGYKRSLTAPVGGRRRGVMRLSDFLLEKTGFPDGKPNALSWLRLPDYSLAEVCNGEVFKDGPGLLTEAREFLSDMPEDVRLKKLAGYLLLMAQAGQYNYMRCAARGEAGAAQLAAAEFVKAAIQVVFLLNRSYMPYYKWAFKAMRALPLLSQLAPTLEDILLAPNGEEDAEDKYMAIEGTASVIIEELMNQGISEAVCGDLEKHAYSVNDAVKDTGIRNLSVFAAV